MKITDKIRMSWICKTVKKHGRLHLIENRKDLQETEHLMAHGGGKGLRRAIDKAIRAEKKK